MNILLTASDSFVSRTILKHLGNNNKFNIDSFSRQELDLTNLENLRQTLDKKSYDIIINTAISGQGRLLQEDSFEDFYNNALITENLLYCKERYNFKLVAFSSGAGNNRNKDICNLKEGEFLEPPQSKYSLAKYLMNRRVFGLDGIINLRIFNLFGEFERPNRLIKSSINKYLNKEKIEIWGDIHMDFFGEGDFVKVLEYLLNNPPEKYFEINLCYYEKYLMSQIINAINNLDNWKVPVKIIENGINRSYWGSGFKLAGLPIKLNGLENEITDLYLKLKN